MLEGYWLVVMSVKENFRITNQVTKMEMERYEGVSSCGEINQCLIRIEWIKGKRKGGLRLKDPMIPVIKHQAASLNTSEKYILQTIIKLNHYSHINSKNSQLEVLYHFKSM